MFDSLRNRLSGLRKQLETDIEESPGLPPGTNEIEAGVPETAPEKKTPKFSEKVRTLVTERELIISEKDVGDTLFDLEMCLLENDVAFPVTEEIIKLVKDELTGSKRKIGSSVHSIVTVALRNAILEVLGGGFDLPGYIRDHEKPVKILFTGVNGTGKTTSVAKIAFALEKEGFSVVIGAGDTFRAGAIEQIVTHAERLGIKVIHHQEGADPSAVLFDSIEYAKAHKVDVVLADTAGRFHNRKNLMNQLEKIQRVMKPDLIFYVDEAVAGNDAVVRAKEFDSAVGTDGVVLTKADMDMRGGAAISIAHTVGKPIVYLGTGQGYEDIVPFVPGMIIDELIPKE